MSDEKKRYRSWWNDETRTFVVEHHWCSYLEGTNVWNYRTYPPTTEVLNERKVDVWAKIGETRDACQIHTIIADHKVGRIPPPKEKYTYHY